MKTTLLAGIGGILVLAVLTPAPAQDKGKSKKLPPFILEVLKKSPEQFIKDYDKNKDGFLQKDELPPFLQKPFARFDANSDEKLNRVETEQMLRFLRQVLVAQPPGIGRPDFDALDKNADGRLTKAELKGTVWSARFAAIDANGDGRIDRNEWEAYLRRKDANKK